MARSSLRSVFTLLRAPAEPGLSIVSPQRYTLLRAPAEPGLSIVSPQRYTLLRAPAEPGLSTGAIAHAARARRNR